MSKKTFNIRQFAKYSVLTGCAVAIPAIFFIGGVANYKVPASNSEDLYKQRENLFHAEVNYFDTRDRVIEQSKDTLKQDKTYLQLLQDIDSVGYHVGYTDEYYSLIDRADSVAERLRSEYIDKNTELNEASDWLSNSYARLNDMRRDSTVRDSMLQIPLGQRFKNNWVAVRTDWHTALLKYHQNRLQKLQQKQK